MARNAVAHVFHLLFFPFNALCTLNPGETMAHCNGGEGETKCRGKHETVSAAKLKIMKYANLKRRRVTGGSGPSWKFLVFIRWDFCKRHVSSIVHHNYRRGRQRDKISKCNKIFNSWLKSWNGTSAHTTPYVECCSLQWNVFYGATFFRHQTIVSSSPKNLKDCRLDVWQRVHIVTVISDKNLQIMKNDPSDNLRFGIWRFVPAAPAGH